MTILYLNAGDHELEYPGKLAGIRRFARTRGWRVEVFRRRDVTPADVPALLRKIAPAGCVVEDTTRSQKLPSSLFKGIPFVYLDPTNPAKRRGHAIIVCDQEAVADAAFRELAAGAPPCYAVVPSMSRPQWNERRISEFQSLCSAHGRPCIVFSGKPDEKPARWKTRISQWISSLPNHVAVFAANDYVGQLFAETALQAGRRIPQDMTLVGVDDVQVKYTDAPIPGISSVKMDFELAGYLAAKALGEEMTLNSSRLRPDRMQSNAIECRRMQSPAATGDSTLFTFGPLLVVRRESTRGRGRREPHVLQAVEIIRREACDGLTAAALAARVPGSRKHFERRFREAMGHSVLDEILDIRLQAALDMLSRPETAINAIADFCGFETDRELRKLFRARFGTSMREWRKRHLR